jgi:hypothetical protein
MEMNVKRKTMKAKGWAMLALAVIVLIAACSTSKPPRGFPSEASLPREPD